MHTTPMVREENGMATTTTTTMVPSTPNTAVRGGMDEDAEDSEGKGGTTRGTTTTRGRGKGYARGRDGRDGRDRAYVQEDTHHHGAQGTVPPGRCTNDSIARMAHPPP
jgi:hypothetical protein